MKTSQDPNICFMKYYTLIGMILLIVGCSPFINKHLKNFDIEIKKGEVAEKAGDYNEAIAHYSEALKVIPTHPPTVYNIARLNALSGNDEYAINYLMNSISLGYGLAAVNDTAFVSLKDTIRFSKVLSKIDEMKKTIHKSELGFTYDEKDLAPESVAYDPVEEAFYLGSLYKCKIVRIDKEGNATDFITEKQNGLRMVIGIKVDAERRVLWTCNAVGRGFPPGIEEKETGWTALFKFDLTTGKLINKYILHEEGVMHQFNDLTITKSGDVYTTNYLEGAIYRVLNDKDELELFYKSEELISPNGITFSDNENTIFVSGWKTFLYKIDFNTRKLSLVEHPDSFSTYGIDGIYYYKNSLLAVQDGLMIIARYYLNEDGSEIERREIIEANNPVLDVPTTGVLVDDQLYYVANCPSFHFHEDGSLVPDELNDVTILKTKL